MWVKADLLTCGSPRVLAVAKVLGAGVKEVVGWCGAVVTWALAQCDDCGAAPGDAAILDVVAGKEGLGSAAVEAGWVVQEGGAIRFTDFDRGLYGESRARWLRSERNARYRRRRAERLQASSQRLQASYDRLLPSSDRLQASYNRLNNALNKLPLFDLERPQDPPKNFVFTPLADPPTPVLTNRYTSLDPKTSPEEKTEESLVGSGSGEQLPGEGMGCGEGKPQTGVTPPQADLFGLEPTSQPTPKKKPAKAADSPDRALQAREVMLHYQKVVRPSHGAARGTYNVSKLLAQGVAVEELKRAADHYAAECDRLKKERVYRVAVGNFYGRDAVYQDYLLPPQPDQAKPAGPTMEELIARSKANYERVQREKEEEKARPFRSIRELVASLPDEEAV